MQQLCAIRTSYHERLMPDCSCDFEPKNAVERKTLIAVLAINAVMFVVEFMAGWLANSTGLIADSLDMLADASVYAISLFALGRSARIRGRIALASGVALVLLGVGVLADVGRRFVAGSEPVGVVMISVGALALAANVLCLFLLAKHRHGSVNLRASWVFSATDVIVNCGVIASGVLVWLTASRWSDLAIGLIITAVVIRGGIKIIKDARGSLAEAPSGA